MHYIYDECNRLFLEYDFSLFSRHTSYIHIYMDANKKKTPFFLQKNVPMLIQFAITRMEEFFWTRFYK